jgi:hypothetical protein
VEKAVYQPRVERSGAEMIMKMRRGRVWSFVTVVVTTSVLENDGGGGGWSSNSDTLASLNTAVGVESVCSSLFLMFVCFPPSRFDKGVVRR